MRGSNNLFRAHGAFELTCPGIDIANDSIRCSTQLARRDIISGFTSR